MKKLQLLNTSEYLTGQTLRRALEGTRYGIYARLPLKAVIQREKGEALSRADKNFLNTSELDFVVYDEHSVPQLAIEFDGPSHEAYEDQQARDIRKNRLCQRAGLRLIRIGDIHLEEHDKTTLLEHIITRFVSWQVEKDEILAEINEYIATLTEQHFEDLTEGGVLDPDIDPTFTFDLRHPFLAANETANRLYTDFGIVSRHLPSDVEQQAMQRQRVLYLCIAGGRTDYHGHYIQVGRDYNLLQWFNTSSGRTSQETIHEVRVSFRLRWTVPVVDDYDETEGPGKYWARTGKLPVAFQDLPGISMHDLAENFCDYLALKKTEEWATQHVS